MGRLSTSGRTTSCLVGTSGTATSRWADGRKHERHIELEDWQSPIVRQYPDAFLRGLVHSDGARVKNWATRVVGGEKRRYDDPRWQFDRSEEILHLCSWARDLAEVAWRRSGRWTISVSRGDAVARLDALIGPKV